MTEYTDFPVQIPGEIMLSELLAIAAIAGSKNVTVQHVIEGWIVTGLAMEEAQKETSAINIAEVPTLVPGTDQSGPAGLP